jgi:hypothetical protein
MTEEAADQHIFGIGLGNCGKGFLRLRDERPCVATDVIGQAPDLIFHSLRCAGVWGAPGGR